VDDVLLACRFLDGQKERLREGLSMVPNRSKLLLRSVLLPLLLFVLISSLTPSVRDDDKGLLALCLLLFTPLSFGIYYFWSFRRIPGAERILFPLILWPLGLAVSYGIGFFLLRDLFHSFYKEDRNGRVIHEYVFLDNLCVNTLTTTSFIALLRLWYFMFSKS
jgi:hypothetical protein